MLYVDDGSREEAWRVLYQLDSEDSRVSAVRLSHNFGKEAALTAGIDLADPAYALVVIDAEPRDPPI